MDDRQRFGEECSRLIDWFCAKHTEHRHLPPKARRIVKMLVGSGEPLRGKPGGWAGGIVHAMTHRTCGIPGVLNADAEKAFGATIGIIRKRSAQIDRLFDVRG